MTPEQFLQSGLKITELPAKSYPILEDLLPFIDRAEQEETNLDTVNYLRNIKQVILICALCDCVSAISDVGLREQNCRGQQNLR